MIPIPARPYDYPLDPSHTALVVIDMQRDFIERGGFGDSLGNDVKRLEAIVPATARLISIFREQRWPIVHTREAHLPDLSDCPPSKIRRGNPSLHIGETGAMGRLLVRGEPGNQIVDDLRPLEGEIVIDKPGKGMFWATGLHETLQGLGITHLVFAGVTTEVCVQTSMREANDRGYECLLIEEATESYFAHFKAATIEMIAAQGGIVGWVGHLDALEAAVRREPVPPRPAPAPAVPTDRRPMKLNDPAVVAEVAAVFELYESALLANDNETLLGLFLDAPETVRYGTADVQHGFAEIAAFRRGQMPFERTLSTLVITTYGPDAATASTLFHRPDLPGRVGRQMQTWVKTADGWRVAAAHVSMMDGPA
jgi:nicotinamidase-related amidase/ketosteroid isomerase-like protein